MKLTIGSGITKLRVIGQIKTLNLSFLTFMLFEVRLRQGTPWLRRFSTESLYFEKVHIENVLILQ
jgi:hypothetical protein